jgi:hypothetical protein
MIVSRLSDQRGRNGKQVRLYLASSLPLSAQQKLAEQISPSPLMIAAPAALQIVKQTRTRVSARKNSEDTLAAERLEKIQPALEYDIDPSRWHHLQLKDGRQVRSKSLLVTYLSELHGTTERTLWNWINRAKTDTLANRSRKDKGTSQWAKAHPQAAELASHIYLGDGSQPPQKVRQVWEEIKLNADSLGLAGNVPSYETIRQLLQKLHPGLVTLARDGKRAYEETFAPYIRRGYVDIPAGQIVVSDHMIHDVFVQNDIFGARGREHMRLQFTCLFDMRSRLVVGASWTENGSSRSINTAIRHMLDNFGVPQLFYCDNGKDYQKVARGAARTEELQEGKVIARGLDDLVREGIIARLGMQVRHCIKFHPQSKHIERFFGTLHGRFDRLWPTYCGPAPHKRPDYAIAALERHHKLLRAGRPEDSDLPIASEFIRVCINWIKDEYIHTPQAGAGMDGRSPLEVFQANKWDGLKVPDADLHALLLPDRVKRDVHECAITLNKMRYAPVDAYSYMQMERLTTRDVLVAYDAIEPNHAVVLDEDGHVLAHLRPERFYTMYDVADPAAAEETKLAISESMQMRKALARSHRDTIDALSRRARQHGYVSKIDKMRQEALPAAIADVVTHRPETREANAPQTKKIHAEDIGKKLAAMLAAGGGTNA